MSRVLIVEDEAHLAQGLRFNLEAEGHSVEVAGDGDSRASGPAIRDANPVPVAGTCVSRVTDR